MFPRTVLQGLGAWQALLEDTYHLLSCLTLSVPSILHSFFLATFPQQSPSLSG